MFKTIGILILACVCTWGTHAVIPSLSSHIGPTLITWTMIAFVVWGGFWWKMLGK